MGKKAIKMSRRERKAFLQEHCKKMVAKRVKARLKKENEIDGTPATATTSTTAPVTTIKIQLEQLDNIDVDVKAQAPEQSNGGSEDIKPTLAPVCAGTSLPSDASDDDVLVASLPLLSNIIPHNAAAHAAVSSPLVHVEPDTKINAASSPEPWTVSKSLCRCCHTEGDFDSMTSAQGDEPPPYDTLLNVFNIQLCPTPSTGSALRGICSLCRARLSDAIHFLQQVRACDQYFTRMYEGGLVKVHKESPPQKEQRKSQSKRTPSYRLRATDYVRTGEDLQCSRCDLHFDSLNKLKSHVMSQHLDIRKYKCTECSKQFHTLAPYTRHKLEAHGIDDRFKCKACPRVFTTRVQLQIHTNSFHMLGAKIRCDLCEYECFNRTALNKHKFKHKTEKEYHCKFCNKAFLRKTTLNFHERIHTGDRRKVCAECGKAFVQKASLNYHMTKYHPGVKY